MIITNYQFLDIREDIDQNNFDYSTKEKLLSNKIWIESSEKLENLNISSNISAQNSARVQKTVKFGKVPSFRTLCIVTNTENQGVGIGMGKHSNKIVAKTKAIAEAKKNIIFFKLGCGSLKCNKNCEERHSILREAKGTSGHSNVIISPAKKGTGIVGASHITGLFKSLGVKDIRISLNYSNNRLNYLKAVYQAIFNYCNY